MTMVVTGTYESEIQLKNTREELIANGVPQEQIYIGDDKLMIKVMIANDTEPEIEMILKKHDADTVSVTRSGSTKH